MTSKAQPYFNSAKQWRDEVLALREIILACGLAEELKWGQPCYTFENANIVLIHHFKDYCALLFFKGALLNDPKGVLIQQTKNVQAARQMRFTNTKDITRLKSTIKTYVKAAVELEKSGQKVTFKKTGAFEVPEEFQKKLKEFPALKIAFEALTPGRQHAYLLHFAAPKQSKTRDARIEKCTPQILAGKGLNDTPPHKQKSPASRRSRFPFEPKSLPPSTLAVLLLLTGFLAGCSTPNESRDAANLQDDNVILADENSSLESELGKTKDELETAQGAEDTVSELEERVSELEEELEEAQGQVSELEEKMSRIEEVSSNVRSDFEDLETAVSNFDYINWREVVPEVQSNLSNLDSSLGDLENAVNHGF